MKIFEIQSEVSRWGVIGRKLMLALSCAAILVGCRVEENEVFAPDVAPATERELGMESTDAVTEVFREGFWDEEENGWWQGETPEDKALSRRIHVVLSTGLSGVTGAVSLDQLNTNLFVHSSQGTVTLRGEVVDERERELYEEITASLERVREVRNELEINPELDPRSVWHEQRRILEEPGREQGIRR